MLHHYLNASFLPLPPRYAIELTYISNRDQTCKHYQGGCSCCRLLSVGGDGWGCYWPLQEMRGSRWALVPEIAAPLYCYLFTAKDRSLLSTILLRVLASLLLPRIFLLCVKRK